jgi:hypothetical protein
MRPKDIETIDELLKKNYTIYIFGATTAFVEPVRQLKEM